MTGLLPWKMEIMTDRGVLGNAGRIRWSFMSLGTSPIMIFGTSVRAAAFSASRAGLSPWCADLFADSDLRRHCPAVRLPGRYPLGFLDLVSRDWPGPWMYTGGLEN